MLLPLTWPQLEAICRLSSECFESHPGFTSFLIICQFRILVREGVLHEEETRSQFPDCPLPLATASLFRNDSVLKYFLESKGQDDWVNLEIPDTGWTPLMFASGIGNRRAVQLLLDHGANADAINVHNMNALDLAQDNIKGLLEAYTKIPTLTVQDENVLENVTFLEACRIGDVEVVAELISENPDLDVNATDPVEGATGNKYPHHFRCLQFHKFFLRAYACRHWRPRRVG